MANKVFQKRIADGVEKLLAEKPEAKRTFRKHIRSFNKQWLKYEKAKRREEKTGEPQPFEANPSQWQGKKEDCYYTYLAVVYDSVKNVAPYDLCDDILDDAFFGWLQRKISSANFDNDKLTTALKWVEPALRQRIKKITGWIFKKTWHIIVAIVVGLIVAILIGIFGDFGWLEQIKDFIYKILWPK